MASLIERVTAHYDARKSFSISVPEWGEPDKPLVVCYRAPTLAILSKVRKDSGGDELKMASLLVAICSKDEAGKNLFTPMNWRDIFDHADPAVVQRISTAIMAEVRFDEAAVEAAEKN